MTKSEAALHLIRRAVSSRKGIVSYQVVQEFFNVALRRFAKPMSAADAEQYLATVFRPLLAVQSSQGLSSEALRLYDKHGFPWYDCLVLAAAIEGQCAVLYSEDLQHGQKVGPLRIENPFL